VTCPTAGIDSATLTAAAAATSGRMVIAEGHHPEGGLASAVTDSLLAAARSNLSLAHLARARHARRGVGWHGLA
jgi:hypothetical protein